MADDGAAVEAEAARASAIASALATLPARAVAAQAMAQGVPSPCVSVCRMDAARTFCQGCLRSIPEISGWSRMDDAGKRGIWRAIELRARPSNASNAASMPGTSP